MWTRGLALFVLVWGACGPEEPALPRSQPGGEARSGTGAEIVVSVDSDTVTVSDVRGLSEAAGLSPRDAAERLVRERLLAAEAVRRGYADDPEVQRAVRSAAAHALVSKRVEIPWTAETLPQDSVDEACEKAMQAAQGATRVEVEARVREQLVWRKRREALDALLGDLRARLAPEYDEANIERVFAADVESP